MDGMQQCCVAEWSYILRGWNAVMFLYNAVGVVSLCQLMLFSAGGGFHRLGVQHCGWSVVATGGVVVVINL